MDRRFFYMVPQKLGSYAFLLGVIVAVVAGLVQVGMPAMMTGLAGYVAVVLVILGLIVGFLNIKDKHITDFLVATIAVAVIGLVALNPLMVGAATDPIIQAIATIVGNIVMLVAPAALVVGLKQIRALAQEQVV